MDVEGNSVSNSEGIEVGPVVVGDIEGVSVGRSTAREDGEVVRTSEGLTVGINDSISVGFGLGLSEGENAGSKDGKIVVVGEFDGNSVEEYEEIYVGRKVGLVVGSTVEGKKVGSSLGVVVCEEVGTSVGK